MTTCFWKDNDSVYQYKYIISLANVHFISTTTKELYSLTRTHHAYQKSLFSFIINLKSIFTGTNVSSYQSILISLASLLYKSIKQGCLGQDNVGFGNTFHAKLSCIRYPRKRLAPYAFIPFTPSIHHAIAPFTLVNDPCSAIVPLTGCRHSRTTTD